MDIRALLGHVELATTQIYTHVSEDRIAGVVAKLEESLQIPRVTPGPPMSTNPSIGGIPSARNHAGQEGLIEVMRASGDGDVKRELHALGSQAGAWEPARSRTRSG
jgi:hypothetical protein